MILSQLFKISLIIILLPLIAAAQTGSQGITASDIFNLVTVADPQIAPDGKRVVYVRQFADIMTDKNYGNLCIVNTDGSNSRPLTSGNRNDSSPRWSPDGNRLIYISDQDGRPQIYLLWLDTGQTARLTNLQYPPAGIAWSPDGKQISFTTFVPEQPAKIANMPAPPPGAKWADPPTIINKMNYRFNGAGYLKPGYSHLFVISAEGGAPRQISQGNFHHNPPFRPGEAVWTPDSKYLIMSANRHPDFELEPMDNEIYEFAVADGSLRVLTDRKGPDLSPIVSPDGKLIAYVGFDEKYQGYQVTALYLMNRDGSSAHVLTAGLDRDVQSPRWADDGSGIYFLYDDQGDTKLAFCTLKGQVKTLAGNIGGGPGYPNNAYGGGTFTLSRNGTFATIYTRPTSPGEIAICSKTDPNLKVITAVNQGLLADKRLGEVETFSYQSSFDQRKIEGWLIKPPDFNPAKKYPLILEIHGGPFLNYGDRFDFEKQVWAANGYLVLYTNPRGSTSYGGEFGNLIHHNYPGDDFFDLISGVDAVIARGYVDTDNLFVTGGSGGGVLTCWLIGKSTRFRAAAAAYPVINWYSFVLTTDASAGIIKHWFPGLPWDNLEHYEKRSLLSVVKNVKTPTMVITGEEDYRTPISESEQYFQALKLLGIESVLVRVPGEPHGIRRTPSHFIAKIMGIMGWFENHRVRPAVAGQ